MTREELSIDLLQLSEQMLIIANKMMYYGGFDETIVEKGRELFGASKIAYEWSDSVCKKKG